MTGKKIFRRVGAVLLVCILLCTLSACATKLHGKYTNTDGLVKQSFTFADDDRVLVSAFGINIEGKYVIENGEITITHSLMGLSYDWAKSFKMKGNSIFIDGTEFVKEK